MTPARANCNIGGMDIAELSRRLENLIRFGTIHSVDHAKRRARVQTGNLVTDWLGWLERRAGETTTWDPPTIGEQCAVFSPSGEPGNGLILYGVPSDKIDTPSHAPEKHVIRFPDGAIFSYDHAASHLSISGIQTAEVHAGKTMRFKAGESVTFDTPLVLDTGKHTVEDLLSYNNGLAGRAGKHGSKVTGGLQNTGGTVSSNGYELESHVHSGVYSGNESSGPPVKGIGE